MGLKTVYAIEPVMHGGQVYMPGQSMDCDENEAASIIVSGRGTENADVGKAAKKQYDAAQKAAADAQAAADAKAAAAGTAVQDAAAGIMTMIQQSLAAAAKPAGSTGA